LFVILALGVVDLIHDFVIVFYENLLVDVVVVDHIFVAKFYVMVFFVLLEFYYAVSVHNNNVYTKNMSA
jgi:hypothetical protein